LPDYDYTTPGAYFITLVAYKHANLFGNIVDDQVILTTIGSLLAYELFRLERRFSGLVIDCWGIMPNHLHAVLSLGLDLNLPKANSKDAHRTGIINNEQFGKPVPGSIPTIIRSYKSSVTQRYRMMGQGNLWHRGYYEHVIRSDVELGQIRNYIEDNPRRWLEDNEYRG
jgi:REP element-mobilizing transposase RayT